MEYTENYHLPSWAKTDRICMETFNDMTAKLDAALNEHRLAITTKAEQRNLTALTTRVDTCSSCQIYYATYIGTGESGQAPGNLTLDIREWEKQLDIISAVSYNTLTI